MRSTKDLCSLNEADFGGREAEWHSALRHSVRTCRELDDGFELWISGGVGTFSELQRLAALEDRCCGWMKIALEDGERISLRMTSTAPGGKDVIALLIPPSVRNQQQQR